MRKLLFALLAFCLIGCVEAEGRYGGGHDGWGHHYRGSYEEHYDHGHNHHHHYRGDD